MAAAATDKFQLVANETATNLSSPYTSGGTTMTVGSTAGWPTTTGVTFAVDTVTINGTEEEQTPGSYTLYRGKVTNSTTISDVALISESPNSAQNYAAGSLTRVYMPASAGQHNRMVEGIIVQHNQDGTHSNITAASVTATTGTFTNLTISGAGASGWNPLGQTPNTVTYNGNRSYSMVFNGVDLTPTLSPGMRLRTARTVAAPTQCTSLNGTTQYYNKTSPAGMTFTNNFVTYNKIKLTSYPASAAMLQSRYNGTSGWSVFVDNNGCVNIQGNSGSASNWTKIATYQSLPLNKWVTVTAKLDMSSGTLTGGTNNYIMIDDVEVPIQRLQSGTNPTSLIQAGNYEVGSWNGGLLPFPGKISQTAVFNAHVSESTMRGYSSQGLAGTETSLISAYSFNNSINDLNGTNANNLTANGSAVATNADSPFGGQAGGTISSTLDYSEITSVTYSTNTTLTVRVPAGCTIPTSGGVATVFYSSDANPYGYLAPSKQLVYIPVLSTPQTTSTSIVQFNPVTNYSFTVPQNVTELRFCVFTPSFSATANVGVFKLYNGAVNMAANELTQMNTQAGNTFGKTSSIVPVVPGETINLNAGWQLTGAGTLTFGTGVGRQSPGVWVEIP